MDATMLGKAVGKFMALSDEVSGTAYDILEKLSGKERGKWQKAYKMLSRFSVDKAIEALSAEKYLLVDLDMTVKVKESGRFVAKDNFTRENGFDDLDVYWNRLISRWIEDKVEAATLQVRGLTQKSGDDKILEYCGGKEAIGVSLGQIFQVTQDKRFKGGNYMAYVKDTDSVIAFGWGFGEWSIHPYRVGASTRWGGGIRLIVPDSGN